MAIPPTSGKRVSGGSNEMSSELETFLDGILMVLAFLLLVIIVPLMNEACRETFFTIQRGLTS